MNQDKAKILDGVKRPIQACSLELSENQTRDQVLLPSQILTWKALTKALVVVITRRESDYRVPST